MAFWVPVQAGIACEPLAAVVQAKPVGPARHRAHWDRVDVAETIDQHAFLIPRSGAIVALAKDEVIGVHVAGADIIGVDPVDRVIEQIDMGLRQAVCAHFGTERFADLAAWLHDAFGDAAQALVGGGKAEHMRDGRVEVRAGVAQHDPQIFGIFLLNLAQPRAGHQPVHDTVEIAPFWR